MRQMHFQLLENGIIPGSIGGEGPGNDGGDIVGIDYDAVGILFRLGGNGCHAVQFVV